MYILIFCGQILNNAFAQSPQIDETLDGNVICCSQITLSMPFNPAPLEQSTIDPNISSSIEGATFTYQWQESIDLNTWTNISGATQISYDPSLTNINIHYRRVLQSSFGGTSISNVVSIRKIIETIDENSICCTQITAVFPFNPEPINQSINKIITSNVPGATFTYQWQRSTALNAWTNILSATQISYDPPSTNFEIKYRRVLQSSYGTINISNEVSIVKIQETVAGNSICCSQQTAVYPFDPASFGQAVNTNVSSTESSATFTYQWQQFTNNTWVNILGATQASYDLTSVGTEIKYRRIVQSSFGTISISNEVSIIKIDETITDNSICCSQMTVVMPFDPAPFSQVANTSVRSTVSGATLVYQWQHFINNSWTNILSATQASYDPISVGTEIKYRRVVHSSLGSISISNEVSITKITETIIENSICCSQITALPYYNPAPFNQTANTIISSSVPGATFMYQWQQSLGSNVWTNISGATEMSYYANSVDVNFRRIVQSSYGTISISNEVAITKITETITGNSICCSQTTAAFPFNPAPFSQTANTVVSSTAAGATFTYMWQQSTDLNVWTYLAQGSTLDMALVKNNTSYRRYAFSSYGSYSISNVVSVRLQPCDRHAAEQNTICGDMAFYQLQHGDVITPALILGSFDSPDIIRREFGYDYMVSLDEGRTWQNAQPKQLLSTDRTSPYFTCHLNGGHGQHEYIPQYSPAAEPCAIYKGLLDYLHPSITFDINKGPVQRIYIRRDYYEWYDPFDCSVWNFPPYSCGPQWFLKAQSNVVTITLTSGDIPKPVAPITSSRNHVNCFWSDQTMTFSVPRLNSGEYYKWTIPSTWTAHNVPLEGAYLNQISVGTNSGDGNYAKGGQVCLDVIQVGQTVRQCINIVGSSPTIINLPPTIQGCEGETVVIKPTLKQNNTVMNPADYNFSWQAYQSQNIICGNPNLNNCKELSLKVSNVQQNPTQVISLTVRDNLGCKASASTTLNTSPGWQMGILNSYADPVAKSTSTLSLDESNNYLYFVQSNGIVVRSYFDNVLMQWEYIGLKDKTTNVAIKSDGPVVIYKGITYKLFYVLNKNLYYCESTDNGQTWVNYSNNVIVSNIDSRIKVDGNNIYFITSDRQVYFKPISNTNAAATLVGNIGMNYSTGMFTVEGGIVAYADQSTNIVAFNATTGASYSINVSSVIKQLAYNSTISVYSGNIYFVNSTGSLIILKRNLSTGVYDTHEEVKNLQLAGPFAINKQTGTVYAKAYNVEGKQIYYLNGQWQTAPIRYYLSSTPIQSGMVYGNGHAFYISTSGYLSNTFYIAPCIPAVLRTAGNDYSQTGDILNDPLSTEIAEEHTMLIYPNPTNSQIKATFTIPDNSEIRVNIIPITGGSSDVLINTSMESGSHELSLDLSYYSSGVYLIQLYVNESLYATSKVIKF